MTPSIYNLIVYTVIITSLGNDWTQSSPHYLEEKSVILNEPEREGYGFAFLDVHNMGRAIAYCKQWHLEIPKTWLDEMENQDAAYHVLTDLGVIL